VGFFLDRLWILLFCMERSHSFSIIPKKTKVEHKTNERKFFVQKRSSGDGRMSEKKKKFRKASERESSSFGDGEK